MKELDAKFNHHIVEEGKYDKWVESGIFNANIKSNKQQYSIILPPPNVTGKLHLGHAWDGTLQDILIRYHHLLGYETMWIAGMDHAGIATQAKVDERLASMGISRYDLGREGFLEKAWEWKSEYADIIRKQWGKLGFALDYSKEKFTLDEDVNQKVCEVFVKLYEKGLIYQGYRITNWDPAVKTALSDIEVIYKEVQGKFYHLRYPLADGSGHLVVATTRPETLFGDQALAVNPNDERYGSLVGKEVIIPGTEIKIPIIADDYVDQDFGSGVVKITPAHDPNDYQVGVRHDLKMPIIMNLDGTMNENCFEFNGMDRFECRKALIEKLSNLDLVEKIEDYTHNVGHSERSGVVVETMLSKQWFVKMDELANQAITFQKNNLGVKFYPQRFEKTFLQWMENIQDWCISRQLWWGHRIPAWYHNETGEVYVGLTPPQDIEIYTQDQDVLDTWFSSALWPMATTIWREDNQDMDKFYPTNVLVTGYDIIFFWVSRMIFQAIEFSGQKPFNDVLIHGLIRAADGRKMSKSLGNGIDPMDVIESHGADALRLFLIGNSAPGQDLRYSDEKLDASWNFLNKVWNVSRFVIQNTDNITLDTNIDNSLLDDADLYIIEQYNQTLDKINYYMNKYEFGEVSKYLIHFIRDEFSSWYLENTKIYFANDDQLSNNKKLLLKTLLNNVMIMLHPFAPFITDEIYAHVNPGQEIFNQTWPQKMSIATKEGAHRFALVKQVITVIRNFREQEQIGNKKPMQIMLESNIDIANNYPIIEKMANIEAINPYQHQDNLISFVEGEVTIHIINNDLIDQNAKREKLQQQLENVLNEVNRSLKMLSNEKFVGNANPDKIKEEVEKAAQNISQYRDTCLLLGYNDIDSKIIELEGVLTKL